MENLRQVDPDIAEAVQQEAWREDGVLEMIASENHTYPEILEVQGSVLTNKYAEGYPGKRYYGGCEFVDEAEKLARERVKKLFNAEHANVQPHSGTQANMAVYFSCLNPGDKILGMELSHGGHLSHGHPANFSGKLYEVESYKIDEDTGRIDYDEVEKKAKDFQPDLIISGASAYPREINYKRFGEIAEEIDAYHLADIAHPAGLIAAGLHQNPINHADFVTSTTQKTLRGPRGGFILCDEKFADEIDSEVFPGVQGGPLMHVIAAKAVGFKKALEDDFKDYQNSIIENSKALSSSLKDHGWNLVSGGTDSHIILVDLREQGITGKKAENALEEVDIVANKNTIPGEERSPTVTSGLRLGTSCLTARGINEKEMEKIGELISQVLSNPENNSIKQTVKKEVEEICEEFPVYPSLEIWID